MRGACPVTTGITTTFVPNRRTERRSLDILFGLVSFYLLVIVVVLMVAVVVAMVAGVVPMVAVVALMVALVVPMVAVVVPDGSFGDSEGRAVVIQLYISQFRCT